LLIGDSFTWGYTANPIDSCFADLLKSDCPEHQFYNGALPGVDIVSYKKNIEMLTPILKPNIVIINFFTNDFIFYDKKLIPYENNDLFLMNIGGLMNTNYDSNNSDSIEIFETYIDAYNYFKNECMVTDKQFYFLAQKSSLFTQVYGKLRNKNSLYDNVKVRKYLKDDFATVKQLVAIQKYCNVNDIKLIVSIIPDESDMGEKEFKILKEKLRHYFSDKIEYHLLEGLEKSDYVSLEFDTHFNNMGHKKYSKFLESLILKL
jgi:hypothetical protein